jgi:hypothetical protein
VSRFRRGAAVERDACFQFGRHRRNGASTVAMVASHMAGIMNLSERSGVQFMQPIDAYLGFAPMSKPNHLLDHLCNPTYHDKPSSIVLPIDPARCSPHYMKGKGNWGNVAEYIAGTKRWPVKWFPDANVAFRDDTQVIWDALRVAALGSKTGSTGITGVAGYEMKEWLDDPWHHKNRAQDIRTALDGGTWIKKLHIRPDSPLYPAILGYTHLLGKRRSIARGFSGRTMLGTDAANKTETMNAIGKRIGARAQGLAKKGRRDAEKKGVINISDELHCLLVIGFALLNSEDSVILTADEDFMEIFWKAQWFFDTHYRAYLAAKMVKEGLYGDPVSEFKDTSSYFDGPLVLYRRNTTDLREVLPSLYRIVRVAVLYVSPAGFIHRLGFSFESQMVDMLEMRSKTGGRCTDLFGHSNIHVDLGPLKVKMDGLYLGIGRDDGNTVETEGRKVFLAQLDQVHAIHCNERAILLKRGLA